MGERIAIIGGGQAGAQAVASIREAKFAGAIDLFCAEQLLPYQRPPLSKAYLKGEFDRERLFLRPQPYYDGADVVVHTERSVAAIDRKAKTLRTSDGETFSYSKLLVATGAPAAKVDLSRR